MKTRHLVTLLLLAVPVVLLCSIVQADPGTSLTYCTYLGGVSGDHPVDIAVDRIHHRYVIAGTTNSGDYPTTQGVVQESRPHGTPYADAFVSVFDAISHELVCSTFLGGWYNEGVQELALDEAGNIYLVGMTNSTDFPVTPDAYDPYNGGWMQDGFIISLTPDLATVRWGTYWGGDDLDEMTALMYDPAGFVYVAGTTSTVPETATRCDEPRVAVVDAGRTFNLTKLDAADGSLVWNRDLGYVHICSLCPARDGHVVAAGVAFGEVAVSPGAYDVEINGDSELYVMEFDGADGDFVWGTYLGGSGRDVCIETVLGGDGTVYFAAGTESEDFPLSATGWGTQYRGDFDVIVGALGGQGSSLLWSRDLGGSDYDGCQWSFEKPGLVLDDAGHLLLATNTQSSDIPTDDQSLYPVQPGASDALLASISTDGEERRWITYFGDATYNHGIKLQAVASGLLMVGDVSSGGGVPALPVTPDAYDGTFGGYSDAFIVEIQDATIVGTAVVDDTIEQRGRDVVVSWTVRNPGDCVPGDARVEVNGEQRVLEITADGGTYEARDTDVCVDGAALRQYRILARYASGESGVIIEKSIAPVCGSGTWSLRAENAPDGLTLFVLEADLPDETTITVCDMMGRRLISLPPVHLAPGTTTVPWNRRDDHGRPLPSGRYVAKCTVSERNLAATFTLIR
jgi:hypothetical protein